MKIEEMNVAFICEQTGNPLYDTPDANHLSLAPFIPEYLSVENMNHLINTLKKMFKSVLIIDGQKEFIERMLWVSKVTPFENLDTMQ